MKQKEVHLLVVSTDIAIIKRYKELLNDLLKDGWQILSVNSVPARKYDLIYTLVR